MENKKTAYILYNEETGKTIKRAFSPKIINTNLVTNKYPKEYLKEPYRYIITKSGNDYIFSIDSEWEEYI